MKTWGLNIIEQCQIHMIFDSIALPSTPGVNKYFLQKIDFMKKTMYTGLNKPHVQFVSLKGFI